MYKFYIFIAFCLTLMTPLRAQCDLEIEVTDYFCDSLEGNFTFRIIATGSGSVLRFPEFGFELPLPLDEEFMVPLEHLDTLTFLVETGTAPDICREQILIIPPTNCAAAGPSACPVEILPEGLTCGTPATLIAASAGTAPFTYQWNTGDTTASIPYTLSHFDYAVTVTDANGCVARTSRFFWDAPSFGIHIESAGDPCNGAQPTLTASVTHEGQAPFSYLWSTGDTTATITDIVPEEIYQVTVTDANGCTSSAEGFFHPGGFGQGLSIIGPHTTNCDGTPITLSIEDPSPDVTYTWVNGNDTLVGPAISTTSGGSFVVTGTRNDNPACQSRGWFAVQEISYSPEDLAIVTLGESCDSFVCLAVINVATGNALFADNIVWSSPNSTNFDQGGGLLCAYDIGTYDVTIATPCDTIELFTIIKNFEPCTDLCGTVVMDMDKDCSPDAGAPDMGNAVVILTNDSTNISYIVHPEPDGSFCTTVPEGSYGLEMMGGTMALSSTCEGVTSRMTVGPDNDPEMLLYARQAEEQTTEETTSVFASRPTAVPNLTVFPNPSNGVLQFNFDGLATAPSDVLTLYDMTGRLQERITLSALSVTWRPGGIASGVYQVVLTDRTGRLKAGSRVVFK